MSIADDRRTEIMEELQAARHPRHDRPLSPDELELVRFVRDSAIEECSRVLSYQWGETRLAAHLRERITQGYTPPTDPRLLRVLGVDHLPRYW